MQFFCFSMKFENFKNDKGFDDHKKKSYKYKRVKQYQKFQKRNRQYDA